jgi:hypothetical protein
LYAHRCLGGLSLGEQGVNVSLGLCHLLDVLGVRSRDDSGSSCSRILRHQLCPFV